MRLALVNDLGLAVEAMRRALAAAPQHTVAWTARDGAEAVQKCAADRPDLILMDLIMPVMDGVEATRRIMRDTPCAILVVTATVDGNTSRVFDALGAGALDAVNTPTLSGPEAEANARALLAKIEVLGRLIDHSDTETRLPFPVPPPVGAAGRRWLFAIGSSAGGPSALAELFSHFSPALPAAVVVVQHLDETFAAGLADWLGQQSSIPVRLAREGDAPEPGVVLLPGRADHLVLTAAGSLAYTPHPADYAYRPSVDVFFESVARHWKGGAAGVILTGMGRDGARGLKKMREARFSTIAQDRATSAVYGMPKAAAELGAAEHILSLARIGPALRQLLESPTLPPATFRSP
ncbi:MAG: chemotaxis response regulator protein-glutamate methylesterase [Verrucomicrobia bacterium]|nr:chemotaxis response regulator protein-glutamate methylesterase [Verrucomicrobiota bacterium]